MLHFQRLMENYKGEARMMWEKKVGGKFTQVSNVSFLLPTPDADPQILYCTDGDLRLVSVEDGLPLPLSLDTTGLVNPRNTSVSRDQQTLAVAGGIEPRSWWCTFSRQEDDSWNWGSKHSLSYHPGGITRPVGGDVVIVGKDGELEKFSTDGRQVWARTREQTQISTARAVAACDQGRLYVSDWVSHCIRVYSSSSGELQDIISLDQGAYDPQGMCVTPRGTVFVGFEYRSRGAVSMRLQGDTQWLPIITNLPEDVRSLTISGRHLAVGDGGSTLRLYEVT